MKVRALTLVFPLLAWLSLALGGLSEAVGACLDDAPPLHPFVSTSAWTPTTGLPQGLANHAAAANGSHTYVSGGYNGTAIQSAVYFASVNPDGSLGSWATTTPLPGPVTNHASVSAGSWLYIFGGWNGSTHPTAVYFAPVNPGGSLGTWSATSSLPMGLEYLSAAATGDTIFVAGGRRDWVPRSSVWYAHVNADGTLTQWTSTSSLPKPLTGHSMELHGANVYVVAGSSSGGLQNSVYRASISADGSLSGWSTTAALPGAVGWHSSTVLDGAVYVLGGWNGTTYEDHVYQAQIQGDGSLTAWVTAPALPHAKANAAATTSGTSIYSVGGWDGTTHRTEVYFLPGGAPSPGALSYIGPSFLPADGVMVNEQDGRVTMGDHVHLRLPFKNNGSQSLSNVTVAMTGGQYTASSAGVSIHNGSNWSNQQIVHLTPATIGPGEIGVADFWIYVTDNDPIDRQSLSSQTWLQVRTGTGQWTIRIALPPISFAISGNEELKSASCLHNPDKFVIQKYAQYAAGAWTMSATPGNGGDPDTPEQAIFNLMNRVYTEFSFKDIWDTRKPDLTLLERRHGDIGVCRDYADLTTGLLRSLGLPSRFTDAVFQIYLPDQEEPEARGHAWVEAYLGDGGWRQVDSTWNSALEETVYEARGFTVREVWADGHPLSSAQIWVGQQYQCIPCCYESPVDCPTCIRGSVVEREVPAGEQPDLSCVENVTARYRNGGLGEVRLQGDGQLGVQIEGPTFVTLTVPFSVETGLRNVTYSSLGSITATVSVSDTADSTTPLFDVFPARQEATDVGAGETVTVTWTITPLVTGALIPLRVAAVSGELFGFDEKPLAVNEPSSLPDLTLDGICGLDTALPGEDVALTAQVLDENLQGMSDIGTVVTATVYATPTVQFTTTVNLSYSETSGMYEEVVNLPDTAPSGSYEVDFLATHSGYDPDSATTFFAVRPPLTTTLETNVDTLPVQDTLTMTVGVWDRGAVITEASVWAEITTPGGVITAPLTVGGEDAYTLSLRPFDLRADLGGQVPAGNWVVKVTVDYQGSGASAERGIAVQPTACVPLALKKY